MAHEDMIVRLTHNQFTSVSKRVSDFHIEAMRSHRTVRGRTQHDYDLPAIAWRQILDAMLAACYGPLGGKLKGQGRPSDSAYIAIRKIGAAVKNMEGHPALRHATIEGWVGDIIPAWSLHQHWAGGYACYPTRPTGIAVVDELPEQPFGLLVPQHVGLLDMRVTRWEFETDEATPATICRWQDIGGSWTWTPDSHLTFVGRSATRDQAAAAPSTDAASDPH